MHSFSRKTIEWSPIIALLGIGAVLMPWYQITIFGSQTAIAGRSLWQGKVVICLFVAAALLTVLLRRMPRWQAHCLIAFGAASAAVAGHYIYQVVFPAPTHIEVYEGGEIARAMAGKVVKQMGGHLSFGAPVALLLGLILVVLGIRQWRGLRTSPSMPQIPNDNQHPGV